ncbi:DegT/DnrJ/EryC1/StrS family aminotransferase [Hyphobacterium sp. CCMP332]|nr:DegT/DnrJ/EryC1/StrS family aminotransferase [Hyphobacterium sp. CCMP332]
MKEIRMVDLIGQYNKIKEEVDLAMNEVIQNTAFINGPAVKTFAASLGKYLNTAFVVPCANGTDALQIALMAIDLPKQAEIIVPTFNYVASAEVIALMGYKPVFVDADENLFNLDIKKLEDSIGPNTKAIIGVHLFGQSSQMEELIKICEKRGIILIEDNAQAIGGSYKLNGHEISNGLIGDIGTTSFFPSKNLGCFGDGGAVYTKHESIYLRMKQIANHGQVTKYNYDTVGINSRLDTLQAALLNVKLKKLDVYIDARRKAAEFYDKQFNDLDDVQIPKREENSFHVFHQYTLKVNSGKRDAIRQGLSESGIPSMIYYPKPLHLNNAYKKYGYSHGDFPVAEALSQSVISLPMHTELDIDQQSYICETFKKLINQ